MTASEQGWEERTKQSGEILSHCTSEASRSAGPFSLSSLSLSFSRVVTTTAVWLMRDCVRSSPLSYHLSRFLSRALFFLQPSSVCRSNEVIAVAVDDYQLLGRKSWRERETRRGNGSVGVVAFPGNFPGGKASKLERGVVGYEWINSSCVNKVKEFQTNISLKVFVSILSSNFQYYITLSSFSFHSIISYYIEHFQP